MDTKKLNVQELGTEELVNVQGGGIGDGGCTPQLPKLPDEIQKKLDDLLSSI